MSPAVYVQTNDATGNQVIAFSRTEERRARPAGPLLHRRAGSLAAPGLGRFRRAQRRWPVAAVVNAGSDELSLFAVQPDGLRLADRAGSDGNKPTSVAVSGALVYVLNDGTPNISGFHLADGKLTAIPDSTRPLSSANADPAQVSFTADGRALIVTDAGRTPSAVTYRRRGYAQGPTTIKSSGQTPYGFGITADGSLIVSEVFGGATGAAATSSYAVSGAGELTMVSGSSATPAAKCAGSR